MNQYCINAAWHSPDLRGNTLLTALALGMLADEETGQCAPTVEQLMDFTHIQARSTVQKSLRALEAAGFIRCVSQGRGGYRSPTVYVVKTQAVPCGTAREINGAQHQVLG